MERILLIKGLIKQWTNFIVVVEELIKPVSFYVASYSWCMAREVAMNNLQRNLHNEQRGYSDNYMIPQVVETSILHMH